MIISASRRTDIPAYYSQWFYNRIKEGFVLTRNPMNFRQVGRINLTPDAVDGIVFWTKNPAPMLERLDELRDYTYYFQFTVTPYGKDVEPNLPEKNGDILNTFKCLSGIIGAERVIWRYDPVLINQKYTTDYHVHAFGKIAETLRDYTRKVVFSFIIADYRNVKSNMSKLALSEFTDEAKFKLAAELAKIARSYGLSIESCAEKLPLEALGMNRSSCIDRELFKKLSGRDLNVPKDKNQRPNCGCVKSVDIGMYNTCRNGCLYCYANYAADAIAGNCEKHNPRSPIISGEIEDEDRIREKE